MPRHKIYGKEMIRNHLVHIPVMVSINFNDVYRYTSNNIVFTFMNLGSNIWHIWSKYTFDEQFIHWKMNIELQSMVTICVKVDKVIKMWLLDFWNSELFFIVLFNLVTFDRDNYYSKILLYYLVCGWSKKSFF